MDDKLAAVVRDAWSPLIVWCDSEDASFCFGSISAGTVWKCSGNCFDIDLFSASAKSSSIGNSSDVDFDFDGFTGLNGSVD